MKSITFVGGLPSGTLLDPITQENFPFTKGTPLSVPDETAERLLSQQDSEAPDWVLA